MNKNGSEHTLAHTRTIMEANTHLHTIEQEWKRTQSCTYMKKNGSEHTHAHTRTRMEANTHLHTIEQEWKQTHTCTH